MRFIQAIPIGAEASYAEVIKMSGTPKGSMDWIADELTAMGIIVKHEECETSYRFTERFEHILKGTKTRTELL
jgi:hypothetical protein